jgi:hypothetical protein
MDDVNRWSPDDEEPYQGACRCRSAAWGQCGDCGIRVCPQCGMTDRLEGGWTCFPCVDRHGRDMGYRCDRWAASDMEER